MSSDVKHTERSKDASAMWCDLLVAHSQAQSAHLAVTRRAELYVRVTGLPQDRVYDALAVDSEGWAARVTELHAHEQANREAHEGYEARQKAGA